MIGGKNDQNFMAFCDELRAYVEEHHLFPDKHTRLSHKIKYTRKKINEGTLEAKKSKELEAVLSLRSNEHTGGRKKKSDNTENK